MPLATDLTAVLLPLADPARAAPMRAYMQQQFEFLGIPTPVRRAATLPLIRAASGMPADALLDTARSLWREPARECQYSALDLLDRHARQLDVSDIAALIALGRDKAWWDSIDTLAVLIGGILRRARPAAPDCQAAMDAALTDADQWVRRIAMLHQLGWRGDTDTTRLFGYARTLAPETGFFIRKAIGWALRDYARHDPQAVRAFLSAHGASLSALSRREAARHLG